MLISKNPSASIFIINLILFNNLKYRLSSVSIESSIRKGIKCCQCTGISLSAVRLQVGARCSQRPNFLAGALPVIPMSQIHLCQAWIKDILSWNPASATLWRELWIARFLSWTLFCREEIWKFLVSQTSHSSCEILVGRIYFRVISGSVLNYWFI